MQENSICEPATFARRETLSLVGVPQRYTRAVSAQVATPYYCISCNAGECCNKNGALRTLCCGRIRAFGSDAPQNPLGFDSLPRTTHVCRVIAEHSLRASINREAPPHQTYPEIDNSHHPNKQNFWLSARQDHPLEILSIKAPTIAISIETNMGGGKATKA